MKHLKQPPLTPDDLDLVDEVDARLRHAGLDEVPDHELERYLWIVAAIEEWYQ